MKRSTLITLCTVLLMASCEKDPENNNTSPSNGTYAYVLNEGVWGYNNAEISRINITDGAIETDWFSQANGRGLGDVAQDLIHYGNKLYATVYMSNTIEVVDPATGKSIKQIDMGNRGPRYMASYNGKVYVTCYDKSVVRIDTTTLTIEATCPLSGMQPEQLCADEGKLYVCNSWQRDNGGNSIYDSTLSVVDIATFTEIAKLTLRTEDGTLAVNPGKIKANDQHQMIVSCAGDYDAHPAVTIRFNPYANTPFQKNDISVTNFDLYHNDLYAYATTYDAEWNPSIQIFHNSTPILQTYSHILSNAYSININPANGDIYICNSPYGANGDIYCFSNGETKLRWQVEAGIYPSKVIF